MRSFAVGIVVAAAAGWLGLADNALAQEPRFDIAAERCRPYRKGVIDRQWQVSAPRTQHRVGQELILGLRDKNGEKGQRIAVRARIVGAASLLESRPVQVVDDNFVNVEFPRDFPPTQSLSPGPYTVLWLLAENGGFLACDGFVIR